VLNAADPGTSSDNTDAVAALTDRPIPGRVPYPHPTQSNGGVRLLPALRSPGAARKGVLVTSSYAYQKASWLVPVKFEAK
jgi:hypothetical protein